jgi:phospholipase/carboxylesterase
MRLAGLDTWMLDVARPKARIVFLHGLDMRAADLTPFAHSLGIADVAYAFPQAPLAVSARGFAWWPRVDEGTAQADSARDLWRIRPQGRAAARAVLGQFLQCLQVECRAPVILAGFSQGGMLACDSVLMGTAQVGSLALMSASCIAFAEWHERRSNMSGKPAFVSHGRTDPELSFAAGVRLSDFLRASGAALTWVPFDGGHQIPLPVWRRFKQFVHATLYAANEDSRAYPNQTH